MKTIIGNSSVGIINYAALCKGANFLLFLFPAMLLAVPNGGAFVLLLLLLTSVVGLLAIKERVPFNATELCLLGALLIYLLHFAFNLWYFNNSISEFENSSRFLLLLPLFFFLRKVKLSPVYLAYGFLLGAVVAAAIAVYQVEVLGFGRARGTLNIIHFGSISVTLGLMCLCAGVLAKNNTSRFLMYVGFGCAYLAALLNGSRGSWLSLLMGVSCLYVLNPAGWPLKIRLGVASLIVVLLVSSYQLPIVQERVGLAITEVSAYWFDQKVISSVGLRLEAWRAAIISILDSPLLGVGEGDFASHIKLLVDTGRVDSAISGLAHVHNEYLQAAMHRGLPGLLILMLLFLLPLIAFYRAYKSGSRSLRTMNCCGILLVISSMTLCLADVFFGNHKQTLFYVTYIYFFYAMNSNKFRDCSE